MTGDTARLRETSLSEFPYRPRLKTLLSISVTMVERWIATQEERSNSTNDREQRLRTAVAEFNIGVVENYKAAGLD